MGSAAWPHGWQPSAPPGSATPFDAPRQQRRQRTRRGPRRPFGGGCGGGRLGRRRREWRLGRWRWRWRRRLGRRGPSGRWRARWSPSGPGGAPPRRLGRAAAPPPAPAGEGVRRPLNGAAGGATAATGWRRLGAGERTASCCGGSSTHNVRPFGDQGGASTPLAPRTRLFVSGLQRIRHGRDGGVPTTAAKVSVGHPTVDRPCGAERRRASGRPGGAPARAQKGGGVTGQAGRSPGFSERACLGRCQQRARRQVAVARAAARFRLHVAMASARMPTIHQSQRIARLPPPSPPSPPRMVDPTHKTLLPLSTRQAAPSPPHPPASVAHKPVATKFARHVARMSYCSKLPHIPSWTPINKDWPSGVKQAPPTSPNRSTVCLPSPTTPRDTS